MSSINKFFSNNNQLSERKKLLNTQQDEPEQDYHQTMGGTSSDVKVGIWRVGQSKETTPIKEKKYGSIIEDTPSEKEGDTKRGGMQV